MRARRGFTLIEVLLGLALLALVLSLIQGVYAGAVKSRDRARAQAEGAHRAALVLARLADELASASEGSGDASGFALGPAADRDARLEFTTTLPGLMPEKADAAEAAAEGYARLRYEVEAGGGGTRSLLRRDSRLSEQPEGEDGDVVLERVTRFRVQASADGKAWDDTWEGGAGLPRMVSLELGWEEGDGPRPQERLLRTTVPLYGVVPP